MAGPRGFAKRTSRRSQFRGLGVLLTGRGLYGSDTAALPPTPLPGRLPAARLDESGTRPSGLHDPGAFIVSRRASDFADGK